MKSKKALALVVTLLMGASSISAFSACGGKPIDNGEDPTKANLSVRTYTGGVGRAWLDDAAARFEKLYENATHFQEGRTGVKINVDGDKTNYNGPNLSEKALKEDVYFTEGVDYYKFVNRDKVADITDIVSGEKSSLAFYGEEAGTIEDKLDPSIKSFLASKDGNYYMLPFYDGFYGFIYDVDLFEEEGFYKDAQGDYTRFIENESLTETENETRRAEWRETLSDGPDGEHGTYDDGLPATYDELLDLVDVINAKCVPFVYSGKFNDYVSKACRAFIVDYEGYDAFTLNYTFNGTAELVKKVNADGSLEMEEVAITQANGYELQRQAGKYYALKMQEALFGSTKYLGGSWNQFDYTEAQENFVKSKYTSTRYAILLEGAWWENEAAGAFELTETNFGEKKEDRRFAFLPMPKVTADAVGEQTLFSANSSFAFINKECKNMELAKEFMKFLHTDAEMSKFSAKTSISRSLNYKVSDEDKLNATYFGQSVIDMRANSKVIYPYSSLQFVIDNADAFTESAWFMNSTAGGSTQNNPFLAFKNGTATAKDYFEGLYTYQKTMWSKLN